MIGRSIIYMPSGEQVVADNESELQGIVDSLNNRKFRFYIEAAELGVKKEDAGVIGYSKELGLLETIANTDSGRVVFLPAGKVMLDVIKAWARGIAINEFGAIEVETPEMYQANEVILTMQELFGEEPYYVRKDVVLRPASDFGVFSLYSGKNIGSLQEALRVFEMASCFRDEDASRANPLARARRFYMPDLHTFLQPEQLDDELRRHENIYLQALQATGVELLVSARTTEEEHDILRSHFDRIATETGKEVYVNIVPSRKRYWTTKFKFVYVDRMGNPIQLGTIQTDHNTAELFNIQYEGGNPTILHSSSGSIERWMYTFIDDGLTERGLYLPSWFDPMLKNSSCERDNSGKIFIPFGGSNR